MAGIVAQITKANWERKKNRSKHISSDKCNYYIAPFDATYDPEKHNNYIKRKRQREETERELIEAIAEAARKEEENSYKLRCTKALMGAFVLAVPTSILLFLFFTFWGIEPEKIVGDSDDVGKERAQNNAFS